MKARSTLLLVALFACTTKAKLDDARMDASPLVLSVSPPQCLVATTADPFDISYTVDSDAKLTVETIDPSGQVNSVLRTDARAGTKAKLTLPAGVFDPGRIAVTVWARADKKIPTSQTFILDVRAVLMSASSTDADGDCYSPRTGDCNDNSAVVNPSAKEECTDLIDNDCDGLIDLEDSFCAAACSDNDKDGFRSTVCGGTDCDDGSATINPNATELCDGTDNNCNGKFDENFDLDGDSFASCGASGFQALKTVDGNACPSGYVTCPDCDDEDELTYPGSGNGRCATFCADNDGDTYASAVCGGTDCDDGDGNVHPNRTETCNGVDDNCDGVVDEPFDNDGDKFVKCPNGSPAVTRKTDGTNCPVGWATCEDCNDTDETIHPDAPDSCPQAGPIVIKSCKQTTECVAPPACDISSVDKTGPVLFFTDLISGPGTGGKNNNGVFITLYGLRFGTTRGSSTVTMDGTPVAAYEIWGGSGPARELETIVVQPGAAIAAGLHQIVVTVGGKASNALPFTIRTGAIYFVDPNAATNGNGSIATPFNSLQAARDNPARATGDTYYVHGKSSPGGINTTEDVTETCATFSLRGNAIQGTTARPIAFVGYPDDPPLIGGVAAGSECACPNGFACTDTLSTYGIILEANHYVIANFNFTLNRVALLLSGTGRRFVGNSFTEMAEATYGDTIYATTSMTDVKFYGSLMYQIGAIGIRTTGSSTNVDIGWSEFRYFADTAVAVTDYQSRSTNISVHDSFFHSTPGAVGSGDDAGGVGINLATGANIYNNIIVAPSEQIDTPVYFSQPKYNGVSYEVTAFKFEEFEEASPFVTRASFATIEHNTVYHADGKASSATVLEFDAGTTTSTPNRYVIRNNIFVTDATPGGFYAYGVHPRDTGAIRATYNKYWPNRAGVPDTDTTFTASHPMFPDTFVQQSASTFTQISPRPFGDFTPAAGSGGVNNADTSTRCADYFGRSRTQDGSPDIGAIER
jgi:Putative metal-binding motif